MLKTQFGFYKIIFPNFILEGKNGLMKKMKHRPFPHNYDPTFSGVSCNFELAIVSWIPSLYMWR